MKLKYLSTIALVFLILQNCRVVDVKDGDPALPDVEMKAPNIRIERFSNTKLIRAEGPVKVECGGSPCTSSDFSKMGIVRIKALPKHGEWKEYIQSQIPGEDLRNPKYKNVLDYVGMYENGKRVGIWKRPDTDTGKTISETPYVDGKREGVSYSYGSNGQVLSETNWSDDKKQGPYYMKAAKDGNLLESGNYNNNEKHGLWTYYHFGKGTIKQSVSYANGELNGEEINYYDDGKSVLSKGMNKGDARVGVWKMYYLDGTLQAEGNYQPREGGSGDSKFERVGVWKEYFPNGQLFATGVRKHVRKGTWSFYFNDGKIRYRGVMLNEAMIQSAEVFSRDGKKIGEGKFFFSLVNMDGTTGDIKDSYKPDIPFTYFHDNGKKRLEIKSSDAAIEYDTTGREIGRGGADAQGRKNGCWKESGKVMYYMLGKARPTMTANACGG
jgi:antitoxin component YwqK of YwqJK toxin-antitoxin module